VNIVKTQRI